jgi:hypothetical protein
VTEFSGVWAYNPEKRSWRAVANLLGMPAYEGDEPDQAAAPDDRERYEALTGVSLRRCPVCHQGCMHAIDILPLTAVFKMIERRPQRGISDGSPDYFEICCSRRTPPTAIPETS